MATAVNTFIQGKAGKLSVRSKGLEDKSRPVIVLVQGSNLSGPGMFDFDFEDYSMMDQLGARGFATVTFAIRGYQKSEPPEDPFTVTTEAAMEDLGSVVDWVRAQGHDKPHVLAFSWGGRIAGRWAEDNADKIAKLVLYDPARGGGNIVPPVPTDPWWENKADYYSSKLEPEFTPKDVGYALGQYAIANEPRSPNGIRMESAFPVPMINPEKVTNPTMMIYGVEGAKAIYMTGGMERGEFFEKLAATDKRFVILPNSGDFIHLQESRFRLYDDVEFFLKAT